VKTDLYGGSTGGGMIESKAHEWVGPETPGGNDLVCIRCGLKTVVPDWPLERCHPHFEGKDSGFRE
jgi:hypothetical protein